MSIKIALAGNPNCGKTTLFNNLTGSNQYVGNWPGVTVEKKEGKLKGDKDVIIQDLPGIYSLSPYTLEEVVARNYLIGERPDAILNIIDGTNLERNLYLTTQLTELGIPVVIAINMMDIVRKNGDEINVKELSRELGCEIIEISALKGDGVMDAAEAAIRAAKGTKTVPMHTFSGPVEHAIAHIEEAAVHSMPEEQQRWYAIKYLNDAAFPLQVTAADATYPRIDRVVLRLDLTLNVRKINLKVLKGIPAAVPQPPALTRNENIYDLSLAQLSIVANATTVSTVTDERVDASVCGISQGLYTVDLSGFNAQLQEMLADMRSQAQQAVDLIKEMSGDELLAMLLTVDGAGSGIDADRLDGQQGSYYLNYTNLTNKSTIEGLGGQRKVLSGTAAPTSTQGKDGDLYIQYS